MKLASKNGLPKFIKYMMNLNKEFSNLIKRFEMNKLTNEDKKFIFEKIKLNHPAYLLDREFKENLNRLEATNKSPYQFIHSQKDEHFDLYFYGSSKSDSELEFKPEFSWEIKKENAYITVPSFENKIPPKLFLFCNQIKQNKDIKNIYIDIRGNTGGNSGFANALFLSLVSDNIFKYTIWKKSKSVYTLWRKSDDVIKLLEKYAKMYEDENAKILASKIAKSKDPFYKQKNESSESFSYLSPQVKKEYASRDAKRFYILIDKHNISASLDFIDLFKISGNPNVYLLGNEPTGYDTIYNEILSFNLPSKKGALIIPCKAIMGQIRGSGERYYPDMKL